MSCTPTRRSWWSRSRRASAPSRTTGPRSIRSTRACAPGSSGEGLVPRGQRPTLGVVHRLDKETSGLVVFTRTWLAKQALVLAVPAVTPCTGATSRSRTATCPARTLRSFFIENRGDGLRGSARGPGRRGHLPTGGRRSRTSSGSSRSAGATLVACRLETGRTHQIRIHLSESGHPLVGERVYVRGFRGRSSRPPA